MTHTVFIDLDSHVATASATGTAAPDVPLKHLTKQTLAFAFHSSGTVSAVTGWTEGRVVIKATPTSDVLLLDTTLAATGSTTSTRYSAEWAAVDCDSAALRTLIGASVEPLDVFAEIQWTATSGTHAVSFPIQIIPTFNLPEDDPPDPTEDASWTWLKARLAAGSNVTFSDNDTTKVRTIAAALSEVAWSAITGKPTTLSGYGITDAQPLATILTTFAALSNSAGVLTNNGSGTLSYTGTSSGGNGASDAGKLAVFDPVTYGLSATGSMTVVSLSNVDAFSYLSATEAAWQYQDYLLRLQMPNTATANRIWKLPDASGDIITTGNLTSVTAVGTIASGTWQGSIIGPSYLGTGSDITTKFLRGDGTWQAVSSGITINTTAITSGTSGRVLYNNAGTVGELATTGSGDAVRATSPTLVTPNLGAATASSLAMSFGNITQASGGQFYGTIEGNHFVNLYGRGALYFDDGDTYLISNGNRIALRNATTSQGLRIHNTWTSNTNWEAAVLDWQTTANTLRVGTDVGSGGGTSRALAIITGGTARINVGASGELGFFGATAISKPAITGAHGGNAALQSLLTALVNLGLVTDSTS